MDYNPVKTKPKFQKYGTSVDAFHQSEGRHWRALKSTTFIKSYAAVTDIHFSPSTPHRYVVTSGTRLQVYTPKTHRVVKTISRFKDTVRSGHLRDDGKLIVASDDSGLVQVFDLASRAILRTVKDHSQPVHTTLFSPSNSSAQPQILTSSDDGTVRTFDLATAESLATFSNHDDYVRTAAFVPSSPHLYLSGSYDTTVKLWDARASGNEASHQVMSFNHGHPVESILVHPSGTTAISAGGPVIKIWDLLMGSSTPLKTLSNHQKTVTALSWGDKQHSRLLSAGLDGLVKSYTIHDGGDWRVGHTMRFGGQLLSLALAPNDQTLCVGAADGTLSIKSQPPAASQLQSRRAKAAQEERPADPRPEAEKSVETTWRSTTGNDRRRVPKLNEWDRLIKVFRYADALDSVMERNNDARTVVAVLDELKHLDGLHQALGSRNDRDLVRILKFMNKQISDPRWGIKISEFVQVLLRLYERMLGRSPEVDRLFTQLRKRIDDELRFHEDLYRLKGALGMMLSASSAGSSRAQTV